jgi:hypothetical protein
MPSALGFAHECIVKGWLWIKNRNRRGHVHLGVVAGLSRALRSRNSCGLRPKASPMRNDTGGGSDS